MIQQFATSHHLPPFRVRQFNTAFYQQLISSFDELTTWPTALRKELAGTIPFSTLRLVQTEASLDGATEKYLFERGDGKRFETVLMRHTDGRNTVCVSCMVGCPVGCAFCATGAMGFQAHLSPREIVDQVLTVARRLKTLRETVSNIVFMGMGEPLLNFEAVWEAYLDLTDGEKFNLGNRRITISTSGYADNIIELGKRGFKGKLAVSLHAPNQMLREKLMPPAAQAYPLPQLIAAISQFEKQNKRRISYEYILIDGINDSPIEAQALAQLLSGRLHHVNLIPLNPVPHQKWKRPSKDRIFSFARVLQQKGVEHSIRVTMGDEIAAACGQLATRKQNS